MMDPVQKIEISTRIWFIIPKEGRKRTSWVFRRDPLYKKWTILQGIALITSKEHQVYANAKHSGRQKENLYKL